MKRCERADTLAFLILFFPFVCGVCMVHTLFGHVFVFSPFLFNPGLHL